MGPLGHTVVSGAVAGGVWAATGSPAAAGIALGVGVLMDVDHLYDYYQRYVNRQDGKIFVLFHAWEYSLAGLAVWAFVFLNPLLLGAVLGHLAHVVTDHAANHLSRYAYSIVYRVAKGFDAAYILPPDESGHSHRSAFWLLELDRRLGNWIRDRTGDLFWGDVHRSNQSEATATTPADD